MRPIGQRAAAAATAAYPSLQTTWLAIRNVNWARVREMGNWSNGSDWNWALRPAAAALAIRLALLYAFSLVYRWSWHTGTLNDIRHTHSLTHTQSLTTCLLVRSVAMLRDHDQTLRTPKPHWAKLRLRFASEAAFGTLGRRSVEVATPAARAGFSLCWRCCLRSAQLLRWQQLLLLLLLALLLLPLCSRPCRIAVVQAQ